MPNRHAIDIARIGTVTALTATLALGTMPVTAFAAPSSELQSQLDAALKQSESYRSKTEAAFQQLQEYQAQLEGTRSSIASVEKDIKDKKAELKDAQTELAKTAVSSYKEGGGSLLAALFGSTSMDDFVSGVVYADKVASARASQIEGVKTLQDELAGKKQELEVKEDKQKRLVSSAQDTADEVQAAQREHDAYVNGLSSDLQEALAAEEAARAQAEAEQAAANQPQGGAADQTPNQNANTPSDTTNNPGQGGSANQGGGSTNFGTGVEGVIAAAKSQLGVSYSWAMNAIPNVEFDCAGLIWWSFKAAGYDIPHGQSMSNGRYSSQIGLALDGGSWTTNQADLKPGDLMFWGSDINNTIHVGMCIGGGQMIHANYGGVEIVSVYYSANRFVGGGSII